MRNGTALFLGLSYLLLLGFGCRSNQVVPTQAAQDCPEVPRLVSIDTELDLLDTVPQGVSLVQWLGRHGEESLLKAEAIDWLSQLETASWKGKGFFVPEYCYHGFQDLLEHPMSDSLLAKSYFLPKALQKARPSALIASQVWHPIKTGNAWKSEVVYERMVGDQHQQAIHQQWFIQYGDSGQKLRYLVLYEQELLWDGKTRKRSAERLERLIFLHFEPGPTGPLQRIWKVSVSNDPALEMTAAGMQVTVYGDVIGFD